MADEKDRLGDKLQNLEKAREDQWAAQRDRELLDKLQLKQSELKAAEKATASCVPAMPPAAGQKRESRHYHACLSGG